MIGDFMQASEALSWQRNIWGEIARQVDNNRMPHAILLEGSAGLGKLYFARLLAKYLLCRNRIGLLPCGGCKGCDLMRVGNHPDLSIVEPEKVGKSIGIGDVRKLSDRLNKTAQQGGWKIALINPADSLTLQASNALLKTLEEPTGDTTILLTSQFVWRLPNTVRSRCHRILFTTPSSNISIKWIEQFTKNPSLAREVLEIADGRPFLAKYFLDTKMYRQRVEFEKWIGRVSRFEGSPLDAARFCQRNDHVQLVEWFLTYLAKRVKQDLANKCVPPVFIFYDKLFQARNWFLSKANPNPQLIWEEIFFDFRTLC
ncbi:MAG: DNA polymerase III subunit delta', partial [Cellvibrionales bacterium TMED49]